ncbi:hypothetical protein V2S84_26150, partial [Azotobacter chroococcum]|nr:hypothetical protein [Azotobacter chroococcum]
EETINYLISKLDISLRSKMLSYALDTQAAAMRHGRDRMLEKIDDSQIGLFNIIKGVIQNGDDFDIDELLNMDFDFEAVTEPYEQALEELDSFLMDLGFASSEVDSTGEVLESIREQITDDLDAIGSRMEEKMSNITGALESGSFWEKTKAVAQIGSIVIDIKGFIKHMINEAFDSILQSIERQ